MTRLALKRVSHRLGLGRISLVAAAAALVVATSLPHPAQALSDDEKAALAMLLALGAGIAAAKHGRDHDNNADWDEDSYGQPFRPGPGVVCLPKPKKCYKDGHLSYRWTRRIFGA